MPIQNIQGLVDKNGLSYITNGDYIEKYYNEGLANLGQRNTNDTVLKNVTFTLNDIFTDNLLTSLSENRGIVPHSFIIYHSDSINTPGTFYTLTKDINNDNIEDIFKTIEYIQETTNIESCTILQKINISSELNTNETSLVLLNKKLNIISELFDKILEESKNDKILEESENNSSVIMGNNLFIPIDYEFGFVSNGINELAIYNSFKDVYVNVITKGFYDENDDYILDNNIFSNIFYFSDQSYIKTDIYDYYFSSDEEILYHHKFTLPYVDDDDYWVINGEKTNIQAKAHDAVNLNIILAHYYQDANGIKYDYLSGLNNIDVTKIGITEQAQIFNVKNGDEIISCSIRTPKISNENITKADTKLADILCNSTLIIISKIKDIINSNETGNTDRFGNGFITTMWHYVYDDENDVIGHFECICIDDIALDFNQLTNFENLLKYEIQHVKQVEPDNFLYRQLIFDQIYQQLKQDTSQTIFSYPVLQNLKGSHYNNKYGNNMNFSLKYVNYFSGEAGVDIKGVSKGSDTKYLKNSNVSVTNALYQYTANNKVNYYNEYIPNYNVPLFDMSEILLKDANVLNKYNIITVANNGSLYYSYIGTSYMTDKETMTIGSSKLNINLGENTLTDYNLKNSFNIQNKLNIDFDTINANGNLNIKNDATINGNLNIKHFEWMISYVDEQEIRSTVLVPHFKYYVFDDNFLYKKLNINQIEKDIKEMTNEATPTFGTQEAKYYLYISPILEITNSPVNNVTYYYKYNDLLVLGNLVNYLGLNTSADNQVDDFDSNTNEIISINGKKTYLVSSNNILSDSLSILNSTDTGQYISLSNVKESYSGNTLYVTYIKSQRKLIVNEVQSHKVKSIWKIPTNIS